MPTRWSRVAPLCIPVLLSIAVAFWLSDQISRGFIDLEVYRIGIETLRDGGDMYGDLPETSFGIGLPFIYPPFAALALSPFALLPWSVAVVSYFTVSVAALALTLFLVARRMWPQQRGLGWWAAATALPLTLLLEPTVSTLDFGQVNLILMGLVAADCLTEKTKWPRGVLVGIAAAIKLTPAAFVLYFLVRKDYKAAITAAATGATVTALAFAVLPRESFDYWFGGGNMSGLSGSVFHTNQSIQGVLARFGISGIGFTALWLVLAAVALVVVFAIMRKVAAVPPLALFANALLALLVSPISWSHHWVWVAPGLLVMVAYAGRLPRNAAIACYLSVIAIAWVFYYAPHEQVPQGEDRELSWSIGQHMIGNAYVWMALLMLGWIALARRAQHRAEPEPAIEPDAVVAERSPTLR
ncbi:glycosyltransferase 87 family protein [Nocardia sp. NPDC059180]|uniref:glycosyltransferase 87 family protein n=1 Tax=Nocardia sp. NPDC059180 TaxID=3346761 RepID=UPI0036A20805